MKKIILWIVAAAALLGAGVVTLLSKEFYIFAVGVGDVFSRTAAAHKKRGETRTAE
jgi:hypothetical protein